nr:reverse transcriptase domain-containing protein [Tanacetum cinerariifolium]
MGKFHFSADFVVVDFDADPRVPLIIGRSFLKTIKALIDVYEGELTLRVGKEAIAFNLDQTSRYSANYNDITANRINVINMAYDEYSQEVLSFSDVIASGNPTLYYDPIVSTFSLTLTPFEDSDFLLKEVDAFLALEDDSTSREVDHSYYDPEGDILLLEAFLNDDSSLPLPIKECICLKFEKNLKFVNLRMLNLQLMSLSRLNLRTYLLISNTHFWRSHFMVKEGIVLGHKISKNGIEKDTILFFSNECFESFQTLKKKLTEAPILVTPDWDLPFELICDASDFAICVVLGQRKTKHFQPIHYASKTMTDAQARYTTTEKELLVVVYAFEKFRSYLVLSKSIVYTDHSALKYLFNKQDTKPSLLRWVLLLQEFDITVRDKQGSENLAADHLSRLENPHQSVLNKKEINETFPSRHLVSFLFVVNQVPMSSGGVFTTRKLLTFSRLAIIVPPGDIMAQTTLPKRCLTSVSIGPQSIMMPTTWSNLVTLVNVRERFQNVMKCLRIPSKFARFLTFRALISWGRSRLHEGTNIYSWPSITCRNGLKRKRSSPTMLELFANSLNLSLLGLELPVPSLVITVRTSAMTSLQRSCLSTVSLPSCYRLSPSNKWACGSLQSWFKKNLRMDSGRQPCLLVGQAR